MEWFLCFLHELFLLYLIIFLSSFSLPFFPSFSLSLLSFFCLLIQLCLHHGDRKRDRFGERAGVRASGRVNDWHWREPHPVQTSENGLLTENPTPYRAAPPHPTHRHDTPLPTSVWVRMDAELGIKPHQQKELPAWEHFLSPHDLLTIQIYSKKQWKDNGWLF